MNRTRIEWTDFTWNPITGCNRACSYCYAKKMAYRLAGRCGYDATNPFEPTYHHERLNEPRERKNPSEIFTCSMGDLFDSAVPEEWREAVYTVMDKTPQHTYQILTKQVQTEPKFRDTFPKNLWLGVTIDGSSDYWEKPLATLKSSSSKVKFISFEPIVGDCLPKDLSGIDWCILGAETEVGAQPVNHDYVLEVINLLNHYQVPVFVKDNLRSQLSFDWANRREFPKIKNNDITPIAMVDSLDDWL
jgi:protein gp37